ncbi:Clavaminate synthase-like protein [Mycena olivaceomarginata]|nr:Clavaminate synthase-like protein [Mycena olivaceomarginata]
MPSLTVPSAPRYISPPPTQEKLDYADLAVIDLSKAHDAQGRAELAVQVTEAMKMQGFFYVINHGYTSAQTERMFDIADIPFSGVSDEEKSLYRGKMKETGSFQGYKPRQYWVSSTNSTLTTASTTSWSTIAVRNSFQISFHPMLFPSNLRSLSVEAKFRVRPTVNRDVTKRQHPEAVRPFLPEIEAFARHTHLTLMARGLELHEDALVDLHGFDSVGETYVRFMKYYPRSEAEELKTNNVWLKGHTDMGSITVLYSQPVAALQILARDGKWRWIRHVENALVINAGDALELLSGGYYKATIHRVVQPPADQQTHTRLGLFYFCMTDDAVQLSPDLFSGESAVLQRVGVVRRCAEADAPSMEQWRRARTSAYGQSELKKTAESKVEEEVINGVVVRHYS